MILRPFALCVVLAAASIAGCATPPAPAALGTADASPSVESTPGGANAPADAAQAGVLPAQADGTLPLRAIAVTGTYSDYGYGLGWPTCATPPDCTVHIPTGVHLTGTLAGDANGIAHGNLTEPATPDHFGAFYKNPWTFTGTIEGCGSGTVSFHVNGFFGVDANGWHTNETIRLIPGATSSGLAGLVDAAIYLDTYDWPGVAPITGTVWCR